MKCSNCGYENTYDSKFCKKCGTTLSNGSNLNKNDISSRNATSNDNKSISETNMNKPSNTLIIAILAIFCVVVVGALILSSGGNQVATVGGIDFNIPEGFTENEDYSVDSEYDEESDAYLSCIAFEDDLNQNGIFVMVAEPADYSAGEDALAYFTESFNAGRKTINGHSGYIANINSLAGYVPLLDNGDDIHGFVYEETGKIVIVASNDTSYFADVII